MGLAVVPTVMRITMTQPACRPTASAIEPV